MPFYKKYSNNYIDEAILSVKSPTYKILISEHEKYTYPVDDWYYFETKEEAYNFFNIELPFEQ